MTARKDSRKKATKSRNPKPGAGSGTRFPIVGVGASAGGLEAFERFFRHVPPDNGMAFVLVPHLDPGHASILSEILQRVTAMPVVEAQDQMVVAPDHVYVARPNRDMAIFHGTLQLSVPELPRGHRMPIDSFLRSLAEERGESAIGVILSGTGTDGTLGLRAILGAGGISFVQDPATAQYNGMPGSAIHSGLATYVLPAEQMPERLLSYAQAFSRQKSTPMSIASAPTANFNKILMLLRSGTGHDFSLYKKNTISRRIERRMALHAIEDADVYARYLKEHPAELRLLFKELLISVTSFFRDPEAFEALKLDVLPQLLKDKPEGYVVRVWVPGCATGEEAYSLAIILREYLDETGQEHQLQIYGTDLDDDIIAVARAGVYPHNIATDVSLARLRRAFVKEDSGYRVKKEIRDMIVFARQNVIKDPPFTKLDLISCRNVLIYFEPELQDRVISTFHYALRPGGVLLLSPSESVGHQTELFVSVARKWKLFQARTSGASTRAMMTGRLSWPAERNGTEPEEAGRKIKGTDSAEVTRRALLQFYAPAAVLTDPGGNILYVHGDTGNYLRPAPGQASLNVIEMAREGLQLELRTAIRTAVGQTTAVVCKGIPVVAKDERRLVDLTVRSVAGEDAARRLLLVSFQEVAHQPPLEKARTKSRSPHADRKRLEELERELAYSRQTLQATIEEQQASNEELNSANEELQSTNEELQSTNEELETSKEELQSVNEELATINAELQAKIEQLVEIQNDMKNLLDNTGVAAIFLDNGLAVRRFNRDATQLFRLVASDVGRPLADIKPTIQDVEIVAEAQIVLDSLGPREVEVRTEADQWYQARIVPYRTLDNMIAGVVLSFSDVTARKRAEDSVKESAALAESIVDTVREPLLILTGELKVTAASRSFYRAFQVSPEQTVGRYIYDLGKRNWDIPRLRELLEGVLPGDTTFDDVEVEDDFPDVGRKRLLLNARRVVGDKGGTELILLAMEEVAEPSPKR